MLETRMPPISTRTRRSHASARPKFRPETPSAARPARPQADAEPFRRALPSARQSRLSRSEMRLMGLATACTAGVCALLLLYLAAYAHVTQLGIEQAQANVRLHQNQIRSGLLQAECNSLESPQRLAAAAAAQGMSLRGATPIDYVAARPAQTDPALGQAKQDHLKIASDRDQSSLDQSSLDQGSMNQGSNGGTTEDSSAAASLRH